MEGERNVRSHWREMKGVVECVVSTGKAMHSRLPNASSYLFESDGKRVYFSGRLSQSRPATLLYANLEGLGEVDGVHVTQSSCPQCTVPSTVNGVISCSCGEKSVSALPSAQWHEVFHNSLQNAPLTRAEQLLRERQRSAVAGISSFHHSAVAKAFLFSNGGSLYLSCQDTTVDTRAEVTPSLPRQNPVSNYSLPTVALPYSQSARMDLKWHPQSKKVFAYVLDNDIWVSATGTGVETRLTYCNNGEDGLAKNFVSAGTPPFVTQEEFDRLTGFWWQPSDASPDDEEDFCYRILYEEVDEHLVGVVKFFNNTEVEEHRYPKAGDNNALSVLRYVEFRMTKNGEAYDVKHYGLSFDLHVLFPSMEYLLDAGWIPGGQGIWVYTLDRPQQEVHLIYIPLKTSHATGFRQIEAGLASRESSASASASAARFPCVPVCVLLQEKADDWINVHSCLRFVTSECHQDTVSFIWATEESGMRQLVHKTCTVVRLADDHVAADATSSGQVSVATSANCTAFTSPSNNPTSLAGDGSVGADGLHVTLPVCNKEAQGQEERMDVDSIASQESSADWSPFACNLCSAAHRGMHRFSNGFVNVPNQRCRSSPDHVHHTTTSTAGILSVPASSATAAATTGNAAAPAAAVSSVTSPSGGVGDAGHSTGGPLREVDGATKMDASRPSLTEESPYVQERLAFTSNPVLVAGCAANVYYSSASHSRPITDPDAKWQVDFQFIHVDEELEYVFFTGTADCPTENHLYASYYGPSPSEQFSVKRLTPAGYYHNVHVSKCGRFFVSEFSSLSEPPRAVVYDIVRHPGGPPCARPRCILTRSDDSPLKDLLPVEQLVRSQLFSYTSSAGHQAFGLFHPPANVVPGAKYPTILQVYAGPVVQRVTQKFPSVAVIRMLNLAGFAVVEIDGRGSVRRGHDFETPLRGRLGLIECLDQVEGLKEAALRYEAIDLTHCAVFGWSYGGYMSLLLLAKYPHLFRSAVSVAPVTSWGLYDTGYTERYLSQPSTNEAGYTASNVTQYLDEFPDDENRLLVIHGCADENVLFEHTDLLVKALTARCKPYQVLPFPGQRHGISKTECRSLLFTTVLTFFKNSLTSDSPASV